MNEMVNVFEKMDLFPNLDKKEMFNQLQDTQQIQELQGVEFKILGIIPEMVPMPKEEGSDEIVEKLKINLFTDKGVYHSFSTTLQKGLECALKIFGADYLNCVFKITKTSKGKKQYYNIELV